MWLSRKRPEVFSGVAFINTKMCKSLCRKMLLFIHSLRQPIPKLYGGAPFSTGLNLGTFGPGAPRAKDGPGVSSNIMHLWFCAVKNSGRKWHYFLRIFTCDLPKKKSSIFHKLICQSHFDGPYKANWAL